MEMNQFYVNGARIHGFSFPDVGKLGEPPVTAGPPASDHDQHKSKRSLKLPPQTLTKDDKSSFCGVSSYLPYLHGAWFENDFLFGSGPCRIPRFH